MAKQTLEEYGTWNALQDGKTVLSNIFGKLIWNEVEGARLELYALSSEQTTTLSMGRRNGFLIQGQLNSLPHVTLVRALCTTVQPSFASQGHAVFEANEMIKGRVLINELDDLPLSWVGCDLDCLKDLVGGSLIEFDLNPESCEFDIKLKKFISLHFAKIDDLEIRIGQWCQHSRGIDGISAKDRYRVEIKPPASITYRSAISILHTFRDFCSLALDRPVILGLITGNLDFAELEDHEKSLEFHRSKSKSDIATASRRHAPSIPFSLSPFSVSSEAFQKFYAVKCSIRMAIDFFFSGYYGDGGFINQKFADIVHGLEGLHRGLRGGNFVDQSIYDTTILPAIVSAIPVGIDSQLRTALKKRLEFGNDFSLRRRLKDMVRFHSAYAEGIFGKPSDFADSIADLRNELAHAIGNQEPNEAMVIKYLHQYHRCRTLFQLELFHQLGFGDEFLKGCLSRLSSARFILERATAAPVNQGD